MKKIKVRVKDNRPKLIDDAIGKFILKKGTRLTGYTNESSAGPFMIDIIRYKGKIYWVVRICFEVKECLEL